MKIKMIDKFRGRISLFWKVSM